MADLRDEHGNPTHQRDAYGNQNPQHYAHSGGGGYGTAPHEGMVGVTVHQQQVRTVEHHGAIPAGMLHRSGSSSSSSSEDDGQGGRRKKKGLKDKIKEKLPGGHKTEEEHGHVGQPGYGATTTIHDHHEKKGVMEKIKEKLPGHH